MNSTGPSGTWRGALENLRLSEKSLELNVGAELLGLLRNQHGMSKAYLRGLTQQEEKQEGVDFFAQLDPDTRLFAFQFKAPHGQHEGLPYRYGINRRQHGRLYGLAQNAPGSVFYVFPFYVTPQKLQRDVPELAADTWVLDVAQMPTDAVFGPCATRTIRCEPGLARVNPEFKVSPLNGLSLKRSGIPASVFARWYRLQREHDDATSKRSPWAVRGTRVVIVPPHTAERIQHTRLDCS